jgi:putative pyruvate formate lyase activating enzyme
MSTGSPVRLAGAGSTTASASPRQMHRQVGDLSTSSDAARRGLLVRRLVLPGGIASSNAVVDFLVDRLSSATTLNTLDECYPEQHATE